MLLFNGCNMVNTYIESNDKGVNIMEKIRHNCEFKLVVKIGVRSVQLSLNSYKKIRFLSDRYPKVLVQFQRTLFFETPKRLRHNMS